MGLHIDGRKQYIGTGRQGTHSTLIVGVHKTVLVIQAIGHNISVY